MATMNVNGVVITFESHEAESMIGAAMRLQELKRSTDPAPITTHILPLTAVPIESQPTPHSNPVAQTPRPRGRPRKLSGNPALENAVRALSLLIQHGRLTMDALVTEFSLPSKMSIGGLATSVRNSLAEAGLVATDAYRVETTAGGKVWIRTAKTGEALQTLQAKLAELQRAN